MHSLTNGHMAQNEHTKMKYWEAETESPLPVKYVYCISDSEQIEALFQELQFQNNAVLTTFDRKQRTIDKPDSTELKRELEI